VEDELIVGKLRMLGIDYGQGFGIGRPAPLDEVLPELLAAGEESGVQELSLADTANNLNTDGYFQTGA
jgi:hypothetical protein